MKRRQQAVQAMRLSLESHYRESHGGSLNRGRVGRSDKASSIRSSPGSKEHGVAARGFVRELGRSCHLHRQLAAKRMAASATHPRPRGIASVSHAGAKLRRNGGTVHDEGNEVEAGRVAGSLSVRTVPMKPGQSSSMTTRQREGGRLLMELLLGPTQGCLRIHKVYYRNSNG